jgi:hypothetical protein
MEQEKTVVVMLRMKPSRLAKLDALRMILNARSRAATFDILLDSVESIQPMKAGKVAVALPVPAQQN